ncbi:MAG: type III-B CRISPR-associated protein Cas10/Cmr2 [Campylobacterota bacterium]|nr:type III-B CRISPR-associated protein Cas10/Cmr2 [Campylobacterota bacterium]
MTYIALTIGPIYKTLANAKNPKELFASSYIFSYIMRNIIKEFKSREFVIPYIKDDSIFDESSKVGLFHDRFIFKSQEQESDIYKLKRVIENISKDTASKLGLNHKDVEEYLQINYLAKEIGDENPIEALSPYLDTKELFYQLSSSDSFISSLSRKKGDRDNFLTANKNIIDDLKKLSYHKYYCVVHADGDKMGEAIKDKANIENISKSLFGYCMESNHLIREFGGQTIFAGGDDLMFIAPTISRDRTKTIFDLCEDISQSFNIDKATLSFGISINYIKYPLYEAVENSRELLFDKAKNEQRNNIAFNITKHSGQSFSTVIHKGDDEIYSKFLAFTSSVNDKDNIGNFLDSIHHKIATYETTLSNIKNDKTKLTNFFVNYFNKDEHKNNKEFFDHLVDFIYVATIEQVYTTLRFIKFIQGDKS